ncbi:MotA/TolQ/ExbB proton channel family protein [Oceaniovalibus sp. ACAM 378]|uniref:MotA/TolQ/ExbB proton channel family protein n=1 Tax=Oceaniovalibus sp. ACAM 378 TaxID=2599923 RepID=UPI0011D7BC8C|nr:MotA/TolQ/ExbB proton channel family protein [Oceaniovalibus sp. ACAM 378]TYB84425.1 MotA/TolQ/ExbB proton channel family protein [Oceaniovalibus sp. ACAM 378]
MSGAGDILSDGGPIIWILIVLSLLSLALIAVRIMALARVLSGRARRDAALDKWAGRDRKAARAALSAPVTPADRLLAQAMAGLDSGRPRRLLDEDLEWRGNAELAEMSTGLRLLELIAMVSPLLGLLGTVLGMIEAFRELSMAEGSANAALLAAGIWQALLTTAAGLIVAIPAALAAGLLGARVERAAQMAEAAVGRLYAIEDGLE